MPPEHPSYFQLADDVAALITDESAAWAKTELEARRPDLAASDGMPLALPADEAKRFALARVQFAGKVTRELGWRLDRLADAARKAGATDAEITDAAADRSPPELRVSQDGPVDA